MLWHPEAVSGNGGDAGIGDFSPSPKPGRLPAIQSGTPAARAGPAARKPPPREVLADRPRERSAGGGASCRRLAREIVSVYVASGKASTGFDDGGGLQLELMAAAPIEADAGQERGSGLAGRIFDEFLKPANGLVHATGDATRGRARRNEGAKRFPWRDEHWFPSLDSLGTHNLG
jgi:hypothetical protein